MVLSIQEEITALESEIANCKGPGSKEKKAEIQKKIDSLRLLNKSGEEDAERDIAKVPANASSVNGPIPPYRKVTLEQVQKAEQSGKLCGFDAVAMTASIRD